MAGITDEEILHALGLDGPTDERSTSLVNRIRELGRLKAARLASDTLTRRQRKKVDALIELGDDDAVDDYLESVGIVRDEMNDEMIRLVIQDHLRLLGEHG